MTGVTTAVELTLAFPADCRECGCHLWPGQRAWWIKGQGVACLHCGECRDPA